MEPQELFHQLHDINQVGRALLECSTIDAATSLALLEIRRRLDVQIASVFLFSKNGILERVQTNGTDNFGNVIDNDWFPDECYEPGDSFSGKAVPKTGQSVAFGNPHYSNDIHAQYPKMKNGDLYVRKLGELRCGISVPLNGLNRTFGTLEVLNRDGQKNFSKDDIYWLMLIGTSLANFISAFRRKEKLRIFNILTEKLVSLEATERRFDVRSGVYQFVADFLTSNLTPYKVCIIRHVNSDKVLEIRASSHTNDISWNSRKDSSIEIGKQIVGEVYDTQEEQFITDIEPEIEKFNNKEWILKNKLKSFACLPLSIKGECVGTISVYTSFNYHFFSSNTLFLRNVAFLTAAIVARVRIISELRKVRKQLFKEHEKILHASVVVRSDSLLKGLLHQYKNELIDFHEILESLLTTKRQKDKEFIINSRLSWIRRRVDEIQAEFRQESPSPVDINRLIKEAANLVLSDEQDITLHGKYEELPVVELDEHKIRDIIYNLLSNSILAIKESGKKGGEISINTGIITSNKIKYIQVQVSDNGTGISNKNKADVFEQGFTTRKDYGGTGMGLYVAKIILEEYGGEISFDSQVGKGTKFVIRIPLKRNLN